MSVGPASIEALTFQPGGGLEVPSQRKRACPTLFAESLAEVWGNAKALVSKKPPVLKNGRCAAAEDRSHQAMLPRRMALRFMRPDAAHRW